MSVFLMICERWDHAVMAKRIGLFYGSTTCYTEIAAEKICAAINKMLGPQTVQLHNLAFDSVLLMTKYNHLIMGIPTWDYGELQEDWETQWDTLGTINLRNKDIALFGLGDQIGYPEWFQDALGYLWHRVVRLGASTKGEWPNIGYDFIQSKALNEEKNFFVGLALDEENQFDIVDDQICQWSSQVVKEFGLSP
jgi:flavodoxin II